MHCLRLCLYRKCYGDHVRENIQNTYSQTPRGELFYELHTAKGISVTLNEIKKILTKISTALTIEHLIDHRRTPSTLEVGPGAREE